MALRKFYQQILKEIFYKYLTKERARLNLTQEKMAEILSMDTRNFVNLDNKKNSCNALTLSLFLIYCCHDPIEFLKELQCGYEEKAYNEFAQEAVSYRQKLPIKELHLYSSDDSIYPLCPRCRKTIEREYTNYCICCGQRLQWKNWANAPCINNLENV